MPNSKFLSDSKKLNIAFILLLVCSTYIIFSGLLYAIAATMMAHHISYTGLTMANVRAYSPRLAQMISIYVRFMGLEWLSFGFSSLYILLIGFRKGEKWAWYHNLIGGAFIHIPNATITYIVIGFQLLYFIAVFILVLWIIALSISYKEIFK